MARYKIAGFLVFEWCEEYEQALGMLWAEEMPEEGILIWASESPNNAPHLFDTRREAREAIARTEHYRLAFGRDDLPEKKLCKVVPVKRLSPTPTESEQE